MTIYVKHILPNATEVNDIALGFSNYIGTMNKR